MPRVEVIEVSQWLIEHSPEMRLQIGGQHIAYKDGRQLGSLYIAQSGLVTNLDYLPTGMLKQVANVADFARVLVFDKWTSNSDGRQAVFYRIPGSRRYSAAFIDQGYCFNAGEWTFADYPLRGVYSRNEVYDTVTGWESFEPALTRAEVIDPQCIWECAAGMPEEWYEGDRASLERLVDDLGNRRKRVRKLIEEFRASARRPFPNWNASCRGCWQTEQLQSRQAR